MVIRQTRPARIRSACLLPTECTRLECYDLPRSRSLSTCHWIPLFPVSGISLSFSCQKQEKCLLLFRSRRAKSTHCDHFWKVCKTAEGGRDAAVLTLYKSRGETESWKRCVWRERERERERAHEQWALLSNARGVCPNCGAHSLTRPFEHCNTSATCFEHCFRGLLQLHWHFTNHVCSAPEAWYALDDSLL